MKAILRRLTVVLALPAIAVAAQLGVAMHSTPAAVQSAHGPALAAGEGATPTPTATPVTDDNCQDGTWG